MKTHYVYKLEHPITKEYYFGSRTCEKDPHEDNYMGSMVSWQPNKNELVKTIIKSDFENRDTATEYEAELITEHINNSLNRNYHIPNKGFHGRPPNSTNKTKWKMSKDWRYEMAVTNQKYSIWEHPTLQTKKVYDNGGVKVAITEYVLGMKRPDNY